MKHTLGILLMLVAIGLLIPGVTLPILTLTGTVDKAEMVDLGMRELSSNPDVPAIMLSISEQLVAQLKISGEIPAYEKTRSIVGTVEELALNRQYLVAFLIALFSVIVPVLKCLLMLLSALARGQLRAVSDGIVRLISKWSMADVFVVAVVVAYLAAQSTRHTEELFTLYAELGDGFYYFLGYCLLSILSMQLMAVERNRAT